MDPVRHATKRKIYTVSQLTSLIKNTLEDAYPFVWVTGEISNFSNPASGHYYFTLKDDLAQIRAVMFKGQARGLRFMPEDAMNVICLGRIAVYEAQGVYQIIVEHIDPAGLGALALAFEQLKSRLSEEGLFDQEHKKPIPFMPRTINVITSPTGAVIHDILKVIGYRHPNVRIKVWPVKVQGKDSAKQIVEALEALNMIDKADVIIIARGGGSLEDLEPFNSEEVARAVFASEIPVISAVGHETDFTICDFVADLRAPTPSAAAELAVPEKEALTSWCAEKKDRLVRAFRQLAAVRKSQVDSLGLRIQSPRRQVDDRRLRLDHLNHRLCSSFSRIMGLRRERLALVSSSIKILNPLSISQKHKASLDLFAAKIQNALQSTTSRKKARLQQARASLEALDPSAILARGYSITRVLPEKSIITKAGQTKTGQDVEITLSTGNLTCEIKKVEKGDDS